MLFDSISDMNWSTSFLMYTILHILMIEIEIYMFISRGYQFTFDTAKFGIEKVWFNLPFAFTPYDI